MSFALSMLQLSMQTVVAGLLRRDGKLLIAQRRRGGQHPLQWEFPGGKVEPRETEKQALGRELQEELGIAAVAGVEFARYQYAYPGKSPILLVFYEIEHYSGKIEEALCFETLKWESLDRLNEYDFLAGDLMLIELLRKVHVDQVE